METRKKKGRRLGPLGGIAAFLAIAGGKLKFLLPLLKLGKIGGTLWSMALMVGAYAFIYPWTFAIGIVLMIFIHEMGHVLAAKRKGLPVTAPAFIPFLGALISLKKQPTNAATEAYVALGGPLIGSLGALVCFLLAYVIQSPALLSVAQIGFFLNLINLIPIHPLDGGRIVTAISRWLWLVGLILGLIVIIYLQALIFLLFWGMFAWELYKKYVRKDGEKQSVQEADAAFEVPSVVFSERGIPIPGASHQRDLYFVQGCERESQDEYCDLFYPGVGVIGRLPFPQGLVHRVRLIGTDESNEVLRMTVKLEFTLYPEYQTTLMQKEEYYQVSGRTRWAFGLSYIGLALFLGWMMLKAHTLFPLHPVIT